jgi:glycerol transport system ATP-binding protein
VPSEGRILFDDKDVTTLSPEARNIAQVFQFPVVYDTMTVYDNLAFPLRNRGVKEDEVKKRVMETLDMLDLGNWAQRKAHGLTADLKQKISLGRGMVRSDVNAILFDEPLTVIDPHMKWQLRSQLKLLHKRFGSTMVYVTHDQTEALTFADKVVVMLEGKILQFGTPEELFEQPEHTFVGYFIGSPGMNVLDIQLDGATARFNGHAINLATPVEAPDASKLELGIRPEFIRFSETGMPVSITKVEDIGREKIVRAKLHDQDIAISLSEDGSVPAEPKVSFDTDRINIYADSWRVDGRAKS